MDIGNGVDVVKFNGLDYVEGYEQIQFQLGVLYSNKSLINETWERIEAKYKLI